MIELRHGAREGAEMGPSVPELSAFMRWLALPSPASDDATRLDRVTVLEQIKAAAAAAPARETAAFKASQLAEPKAAGVAAGDLGKGIGAQLALARVSPRIAGRGMSVSPTTSCQRCRTRWRR